MDSYQQYIHKSRYARYCPDLGRRENWGETVSRYITFFEEKHDIKLPNKVSTAIYGLQVMPSMRALMTAGKALERDNVAGYNCSYLPINKLRSFDETLYILMCGVGVGFSVERQYVGGLPEVAETFHESGTVITVRDSKIGWASG